MKNSNLLITFGNNQASNNSSGFTLLPGGLRTNGAFGSLGENGYLWSASETGTLNAWIRRLMYNNDGVDRFETSRRYGSSVRCIQNK